MTLTSNRGTINGQTFVAPIVPTLYTALSAPATQVMNPTIYGVGANPFVVSANQMYASFLPVLLEYSARKLNIIFLTQYRTCDLK